MILTNFLEKKIESDAIVWGTFEKAAAMGEKQRIVQTLIHRMMRLSINPTSHPSRGFAESNSDIGISVELIVYRIMMKKTSRFENS